MNASSAFTSKKGTSYTFRNITIDDLEEVTRYINELSRENTFIRFSGEIIAREHELDYLSSIERDRKNGDKVSIGAFKGDRMVGSADVTREKMNRKRSLHVGIFGISLAKECRGEGLGRALAIHTLKKGVEEIPGLHMVVLQVFGINTVAIELYKSLGFVECGRVPNAIKHRDMYTDEVLMYKNL
jgi:RimJ/RimL family protein N-acetyltransferase